MSSFVLFANVNVEPRLCVCVCVCVIANDSSETVEVIIVKLGTDTTSDMGMHHVLIIQAMPIMCTVTKVRHCDLSPTKGLYDFY